MSARLAIVNARIVDPASNFDGHGALLIDQAGGHIWQPRSTFPCRSTPLSCTIPPSGPELSSVENVWQFIHNTGFRTVSFRPTT